MLGMNGQWNYQIKNGRGEILGIKEPEALLIVPSAFGGNVVKELHAYAFHNQRQIRSIVIPDGVERLGAHCFYDCRSLRRIALTDSVKEIGDGAFKNCMELREISYRTESGSMRGLKGILSELNQSFEVEIQYGERAQVSGRAKLVFPGYLYDYEENTMARIINQVTYGCGVHYRECLNEEGVDYLKYDRLFPYALVNGREEDNYRTAAFRLLFPCQLASAGREAYEDFFKERWDKAVKEWIKYDAYTEYSELLSMEFVDEAMVKTALRLTQECRKTEWTARALQVKQERFNKAGSRFIL